jgi:hypothetical protein
LVKKMDQLFYTLADEAELNEMAAGRATAPGVPWQSRSVHHRYSQGKIGVLWRETRHDNLPVQPLVLISKREENRRLFGRFAQLRSDLSPLTVWCHLITPDQLELFESPVRASDSGDYQAAWVGLIVAEALLLSQRPIAKLKLAACLATQSFAIARAHAIWGAKISHREILEKFDSAQSLFRSGEHRIVRLRALLEPIWKILAELSAPQYRSENYQIEQLLQSLRSLYQNRTARDGLESEQFFYPLMHAFDELNGIVDFEATSPEKRLHLFDRVIKAIGEADRDKEPNRRLILSAIAGYVATVAAGGAPSLALAEGVSDRWPDVLAWAYVIGGIGEQVVWSSGFDGLGRLVARELQRPYRLDEPPTCDITLDEAEVLVDPQLADPLVHLKLKQARVVSLALVPGVNIAIPFNEPSQQRESLPPTKINAGSDVIEGLAAALWPYLAKRLGEGMAPKEQQADQKKPRTKRKFSQTTFLK